MKIFLFQIKMPFFIRKHDSETKDKKRKVEFFCYRIHISLILYQKSLKSQNGKKKQKSTSSSELTNGHNIKKSKKQKELIDENEEILSDSDLEEEDQQAINGNVRLDNLLLNQDDDDDENNVHEQRLKRAKEYIEQIAKQGKNFF